MCQDPDSTRIECQDRALMCLGRVGKALQVVDYKSLEPPKAA